MGLLMIEVPLRVIHGVNHNVGRALTFWCQGRGRGSRRAALENFEVLVFEKLGKWRSIHCDARVRSLGELPIAECELIYDYDLCFMIMILSV